MDDRIFDIAELVSKYMMGELTEEGQKCLDDWLALSEENRRWFDTVTGKKMVQRKRQELKSVNIEKGWEGLSRKRVRENRREIRKRVLKYACVLVLLLFPTLYFFIRENGPDEIISVVNTEIVPGEPKAILYMANGTMIDLGVRQQDTLKEEDGTVIGLHGKSITYNCSVDSTEGKSLFNEIVIPRGGEYVLTLADGTSVCLNAGSKLRFPVQFSGNMRRVELEGEGYFQVVRDEKKPFVVEASGVNITVLGTEFNVSNYPENLNVQTTLVEGSVKVVSERDGDVYILQPGEQAVFDKSSGELHVAAVDVSYATAWKEGRLRFRDRPLKEIMDFISRWYDVDVEYRDEEIKHYLFGCNFNRHATVLPLLELFQSTGTVHFEIVDKKIIVSK